MLASVLYCDLSSESPCSLTSFVFFITNSDTNAYAGAGSVVQSCSRVLVPDMGTVCVTPAILQLQLRARICTVPALLGISHSAKVVQSSAIKGIFISK